MTLLEVNNLDKYFGEFQAINDVSFEVAQGDSRAIIGPNGAGKTTLFNLLSGEYIPSGGTIHFDGSDITQLPSHKRVRNGLARSFQISSLFDELTVRKSIEIACRPNEFGSIPTPKMLRDRPETDERVDEVLEYFGLESLADQDAENLSHGQKRKLEITMAMATDPSLLLLDEPTAGISAEDTGEVVDVLRKVFQDSTVLLVEHDMDIVMDLVDDIIVLNQGEVFAQGTPAEIQNNEAVHRTYLGE